MFQDDLSIHHLCLSSLSDLKVFASFPHKPNLSGLKKTDSGPKKKKILILQSLGISLMWLHVLTRKPLSREGYGKMNKIKQMLFAFNWALSLLFSFQSTNTMPQSLQKANRKILLRITTVHQWTAHWQKWSNQSRQFLVKNYRDRAEACSKHWGTPESSCSPQTRAGKSFSTSYMKFCANPTKEWNI